MLQQFLHRRIEPALFFKLQGKAFRKVAGENSGRVEALHEAQQTLYPFGLAAKAFG